MARHTDAHRLYLQSMMSRGALREAEAKLLCKTVATSCGERYEEDDFPRFTDALNVQLEMELVSAVMEDSPDRWVRGNQRRVCALRSPGATDTLDV